MQWSTRAVGVDAYTKGSSPFGYGYREIAAYGTGQMPFHFIVPWHGLFPAGGGIHPDRMAAAFTQQLASLLL